MKVIILVLGWAWFLIVLFFWGCLLFPGSWLLPRLEKWVNNYMNNLVGFLVDLGEKRMFKEDGEPGPGGGCSVKEK